MAILVPRKDVIETFCAKELAHASRKMINNSDAYRALKGNYVYKKSDIPNDVEIEKKVDMYFELMS